MNFFVILNSYTGRPVPMTDDQGELAWYETSEEAKEAADNCSLGCAYGYEIFERGTGALG